METNGVILNAPREEEKFPKLSNSKVCTPIMNHPLDDRKNRSVSLESLEESVDRWKMEESSGYEDRWKREFDSGTIGLSDDEDEDHSIFEAVLSPDCQDVRLTREPSRSEQPQSTQKRKLHIRLDLLNDDDMSTMSDNDFDQMLSPASLDSQDDIENSIMEQLGESDSVDPIPELSADEEREESRSWRACKVGGVDRRIDMKVNFFST